MTESTVRKIDPFKIAYWAAAGIQMVGTLTFFFQIGGASFRGALYAISGAVCLELMILAVNSYGENRVGFFRAALLFTSLFLIVISGGIQIADIFTADADPLMAKKLLSFYDVFRSVVAATPSFCMAAVTVIHFAGKAGDVNTEIDRLKSQLTDWNTWQIEQDKTLAGKDVEIAELSAKLDEARNRPLLQQVVAGASVDTLRTRSEISLPELSEPATMPDTLIHDDENTLIVRLLEEGLPQKLIVKRLMAGYGLITRNAENPAEYDRQYKRIVPKVKRWHDKQHLVSTGQST